MEELHPTSIINLFDTDKEGRQHFASFVIEAVKEGEYNPLSIHYNIKCMEAVLKNILSNSEYKDMVYEEALKQGGRSFEYKNATIETKETGVKYDWGATGDVKINDLLERKKEIEKQIKDRQQFLKNVPETGVADTENGNMIYRAPKSSSTVVAVTLK